MSRRTVVSRRKVANVLAARIEGRLGDADFADFLLWDRSAAAHLALLNFVAAVKLTAWTGADEITEDQIAFLARSVARDGHARRAGGAAEPGMTVTGAAHDADVAGLSTTLRQMFGHEPLEQDLRVYSANMGRLAARVFQQQDGDGWRSSYDEIAEALPVVPGGRILAGLALGFATWRLRRAGLLGVPRRTIDLRDDVRVTA
ncbi:hypothetical protein CLV92_11536 [Kineococcus xinjiangensis]|uniref:Uncharacterized protein n=1 Tax=Kineococcus xinjiangensis TaxID=512762 RepID=A0A2S6IDP7_9ACTN|nr:hypothetical protein [Kineococcus xinjiangensis]PPK92290.1 hypothetical protein CLV92_11536 [Kineococcus xinjiangensis]